MLEARVTAKWSDEDQSRAIAGLDGKLFASVPEAAAVLRSQERSVRRAIAAGDIPAVSVGPRKLVPTAWLRQAAGIETVASGRSA
jgi:hypothetical protein